jgi:hypothetical protein
MIKVSSACSRGARVTVNGRVGRQYESLFSTIDLLQNFLNVELLWRLLELRLYLD